MPDDLLLGAAKGGQPEDGIQGGERTGTDVGLALAGDSGAGTRQTTILDFGTMRWRETRLSLIRLRRRRERKGGNRQQSDAPLRETPCRLLGLWPIELTDLCRGRPGKRAGPSR